MVEFPILVIRVIVVFTIVEDKLEVQSEFMRSKSQNKNSDFWATMPLSILSSHLIRLQDKKASPIVLLRALHLIN